MTVAAEPAKPYLRYVDRTFYWYGEEWHRELPKKAGFKYQAAKQFWWTRDYEKAAQLRRYAYDGETAALLAGFEVREAEPRRTTEKSSVVAPSQAAIMASRAADADIDIPCPEGLAYFGFQRAGIAYALARWQAEPEGAGVLIADEMGVGKTIQAVGLINVLEPEKVLVVCPASLKINWRREMEKWLVRKRWISIAGDFFPISADVAIVNYDVLHKHSRALRSRTWDLVIADEAHMAKNAEARRSKELYAIPARRILALTGTPIVNRPMELLPLIRWLAPTPFGFTGDETDDGLAVRNFNRSYGKAKPGNGKGGQMLNQLQTRLRATFMVRRLKKDVLTELPEKLRNVIEFPAGVAGEAVAKEQEAVRAFTDALLDARLRVEMAKASDSAQEYADAVAALKDAAGEMFGQISVLRHQTALAKVPAVKEHIREALEAGGKIVLFAHHHDVSDAYVDAFRDVAVMHRGDMSQSDRQASVDAFQRDPHVKLFVGSIQASGVGITLVASSHVVFSELDWVPGNMSQAEDRCHRIGQHDSVLVEHLILEGSLDATMAKTLVEKQRVIDAALDTEKGELADMPLVPSLETHATEHLTRARIERLAESVTAAHIEATEYGLQKLLASDRQLQQVDRALAETLTQRRMSRKQAVLGLAIVKKYSEEQE